jgi:hypothetical protein
MTAPPARSGTHVSNPADAPRAELDIAGAEAIIFDDVPLWRSLATRALAAALRSAFGEHSGLGRSRARSKPDTRMSTPAHGGLSIRIPWRLQTIANTHVARKCGQRSPARVRPRAAPLRATECFQRCLAREVKLATALSACHMRQIRVVASSNHRIRAIANERIPTAKRLICRLDAPR